MPKSKPTFEEALSGLEKSAADIAKGDITLNEAIKRFEKGVLFYNQCNEALNEAKQKIVYIRNEENL